MDQQNYPRWDVSPTIQDLVSLTAFIRKYLWIYLIVCFSILAVSFYQYHIHTYYTSRISFLVNSSNVAEVLWDRTTDGQIDVINDDRGYNRINQIIYSTQMMDYLINKFDLYAHYGIPKKSPDSYLNVINTLKMHVGVNITKTKIITVQISDRKDYNVAADLANGIGKKINDINRQITIENLTRKTEIFESLSKDLKASSNREFTQIDSLLKSMQLFILNSKQDAGYRQLLNITIGNIQSKSEDYFKDLFESYKYRLYSAYSLQEKNLPTISVLEKALPDEYSKSANNAYVYPLLLVFSFFIPLVFAFLIMKGYPLMVYIFRKSVDRDKVG